MPYPGVPGKYTGKIDRCVKRVMADGKSKSSAIAICVNSIVPKKELEMAEKYREEKRKKEARQNKDALNYADDPMDMGAIDPSTISFDAGVKPVENKDGWAETTSADTFLDETEEKGMHGESMYYMPYGGALSWDELDAYEETQEEVEHIASVTYKFRTIVENILTNGDVDFSQKATMIQTAAEVYKMKLTDREKEKGFIDKVKELFVKKEQEFPDNQLSIIQTKEGDYRWFGHFSNNYKDREGEIITAEAHKEFVAYLKENPDRMPAFWSWHIPGTAREKDADFIEYFDGFMIASGPLTEKEAEQLEKAIAYDDGQTGMSHGMIVLQRDPEHTNYITKYRTYEISDLPLANAANGFTGVNLKEVKMSKDKYDRLAATIGEDAAKKVVDQIGDSKELLEDLGVESKEEVVEEEVKDEEVAEEIEEVEEEKETSPEVKELAKEIIKELDLESVSEILFSQKELIESLQDEIKELKKTDEEKVAKQYEDRSLGSLLWRKSQADDSVITEDEAKEEGVQAPETEESSWVADVFGEQ